MGQERGDQKDQQIIAEAEYKPARQDPIAVDERVEIEQIPGMRSQKDKPVGEHRNGPEHIEGKLTAGIGGQRDRPAAERCLPDASGTRAADRKTGRGSARKNPEGAAAAAGNLCKAVAACQTQAQRSTGQIVQDGKRDGALPGKH